MEWVKWVNYFECVRMRMSVWIETFEIVRFEIKIICCEIKKSEMTFYYSWVDILNVLEWECVEMRMSIWQNDYK